MANEQLLAEVASLVRAPDKGCVAFVGSGLSVPHYPKWEDLVRRLCDSCGVPFEAGDGSGGRSGRIDRLLDLADEALESDRRHYVELLRRCFRPSPNTRRAYSLLARSAFSAYVTTNFDPLLALDLESHKDGLGFGGVYAFPDLPYAKINQRVAYYIHGRVEGDDEHVANDVILGRRTFEDAYSGKRGMLRSFLEQMLIYSPTVFMGYSLDDPYFWKLLQWCAATTREIVRTSNGARPQRRYALLGEQRYGEQAGAALEGVPQVPERRAMRELEIAESLREVGIEPVFFDPIDDEYSGLDGIIEKWCEAGPVKTRSGLSPE